MKPISHRGNIKGPILDKENRPSYIDCAIQLGLDVEIDIRYIDGKFMLGHDTPDYKVNENWIHERKKQLWFHCKNLEALNQFIRMSVNSKEDTIDSNFKFFSHTSDPYNIVHPYYIWVHDLSIPLNNNCIIPLLTLDSFKICDFDKIKNIYAVCTDYIEECIKIK